MRNNVLFRNYRKFFPSKGVSSIEQEEPTPFGSHHAKPLTEEQVRAGYALMEMETERQRRLRSGHSGITVAVRQAFANGQPGITFLASLDEQITLATSTGVKRRELGFVLALRERAARLAGHDNISIAGIEELKAQMIDHEGWRMGALDRYVMNHAWNAADAGSSKPNTQPTTQQRANRSSPMQFVAVMGQQPESLAPAVNTKPQKASASANYGASFNVSSADRSAPIRYDSSPEL